MKWIDMIFRRGDDDDVSEPDAPAPDVPDVTNEIIRQTSDHVRAARSVVDAGLLSPQDQRVRRAFEATGRALRATRK